MFRKGEASRVPSYKRRPSKPSEKEIKLCVFIGTRNVIDAGISIVIGRRKDGPGIGTIRRVEGITFIDQVTM